MSATGTVRDWTGVGETKPSRFTAWTAKETEEGVIPFIQTETQLSY